MLAWLVGPDWFDHFTLVMLGLQTTPQDKTGFSPAKAVYGAPLCLPGEFLDSVDIPPREFLDRIQSALCVLTLPPPHPLAPSSACVPTALASTEYVFVHENAHLCTAYLSAVPWPLQSFQSPGQYFLHENWFQAGYCFH